MLGGETEIDVHERVQAAQREAGADEQRAARAISTTVSVSRRRVVVRPSDERPVGMGASRTFMRDATSHRREADHGA